MCYRPSLPNVEPTNNEVESSIGLENIQIDEGKENPTQEKFHKALISVKDDMISHLIVAQCVKGLYLLFNFSCLC